MQIESHNGIGHSLTIDHDIIRQEVSDILDIKENIFLADYIPTDLSPSTCNCIV